MVQLSSRKLDTKGTIHSKMGTTKDRNGIDLTEAEGIKKRWQEYTEEQKNYTHTYTHTHKNLMTQIIMMM